ncbi:beta-L-arabinofuranosidase domain-containing protein [Bacteroidota bacterium]
MKRLFCLIIGLFIALCLIYLTGCSSNNNSFNQLSEKRKILLETAKISPAFIPLLIGEITPTGWIRDWAKNASNGITGHLDEYSASVYTGWRGNYDFIEVRGAQPGGIGVPLEIAGNWLDGALRLCYILKDTTLFNKVSKRLDEVVNGVLNGGESFIYWQPNDFWINKGYNHACHSVMGDALVTYYQATHDRKILHALVKVYMHYPLGDFPYIAASSGAANLTAMIETYLMSGEKTILDNILDFSEGETFKTVSKRWSKGDLTPGHAVAFNHYFYIPALLYTWTGNKTYLDASLKSLEWGEKKHLLPAGILSGEEYLAGIGATRNVETCNIKRATEGFVWMLRITGDASYADRIEKIFFNAAPAPVARDFKTMCYYQSMNRYSSTNPSETPLNPGPEKEKYKFTRIGHPVQCCVSNLNRVIPEYISNMWMATMDNGLAAILYGPCNVETKIGDNVAVEIECRTSYPFEEIITITINPEDDIQFPIYLRIPAWCKNPEISINETKIDVKNDFKGFCRINRVWGKGSKIKLHFPMIANVEKGRETPYPQIAYFHRNGYRKIARDTTINNPYACVYYGPLLFSFAIPDINPNKEMPGAQFNYALDVIPGTVNNQIKVIRQAMPEKWNWSLNAPVQLKVKAKEFEWKPTENNPLPEELVKEGISTYINLVPYGCSKFRVTMFPVTERSWNALPDIPDKFKSHKDICLQ